jgi:hypothetical protein
VKPALGLLKKYTGNGFDRRALAGKTSIKIHNTWVSSMEANGKR